MPTLDVNAVNFLEKTQKTLVLISLIEEGNGVKNCIEKLLITQIFMFPHRYLHPKNKTTCLELVLGVSESLISATLIESLKFFSHLPSQVKDFFNEL